MMVLVDEGSIAAAIDAAYDVAARSVACMLQLQRKPLVSNAAKLHPKATQTRRPAPRQRCEQALRSRHLNCMDGALVSQGLMPGVQAMTWGFALNCMLSLR